MHHVDLRLDSVDDDAVSRSRCQFRRPRTLRRASVRSRHWRSPCSCVCSITTVELERWKILNDRCVMLVADADWTTFNIWESMAITNGELALELFRKACGLSSPLALVCQDVSSSAGAYTPLEYPRPFMLIGRLPAADLCLSHEQVGRRHAFLQAIQGRLYCIDLDSRTKTYWKGQTGDQSRGWLDSGASIRIGPYGIHRIDQQPDCNPDAATADPFSPIENDESDQLDFPPPTLELPLRVNGRSASWTPES